MRFVVFQANVFAGEVGVDLGCGYTCVAEQFLDVPEWCSPSQKMRGEGVAQRMGREF